MGTPPLVDGVITGTAHVEDGDGVTRATYRHATPLGRIRKTTHRRGSSWHRCPLVCRGAPGVAARAAAGAMRCGGSVRGLRHSSASMPGSTRGLSARCRRSWRTGSREWLDQERLPEQRLAPGLEARPRRQATKELGDEAGPSPDMVGGYPRPLQRTGKPGIQEWVDDLSTGGGRQDLQRFAPEHDHTLSFVPPDPRHGVARHAATLSIEATIHAPGGRRPQPREGGVHTSSASDPWTARTNRSPENLIAPHTCQERAASCVFEQGGMEERICGKDQTVTVQDAVERRGRRSRARHEPTGPPNPATSSAATTDSWRAVSSVAATSGIRQVMGTGKAVPICRATRTAIARISDESWPPEKLTRHGCFSTASRTESSSACTGSRDRGTARSLAPGNEPKTT